MGIDEWNTLSRCLTIGLAAAPRGAARAIGPLVVGLLVLLGLWMVRARIRSSTRTLLSDRGAPTTVGRA